MNRKKVSPMVYECAGKFYSRPSILGRRTWKLLKATTLEDANAEASKAMGFGKVKAAGTIGDLAIAYVEAGCPDKRGQPRKSARQELRNTSRILEIMGKTDPTSITQWDLIQYGKTRASAPRAADCELQTLSNILNWGVMAGAIPENRARVRPRVQKSSDVRHCRECMPANGDELHDIAEVLFKRSTAAVAWQFLFESFTGLRTSECIALRMDAKTRQEPGFMEGRYLYCRRGKAGRFPYVEMHSALTAAIEWHRKWHAYVHPGNPWWFPGTDGGKMPEATLRSRLNVLGKELGWPNRTSHGLRAYFVTVWRSLGRSNEQVAAMIGDRTSSLIETTYGALPEVWSGGAPLSFMPTDSPPAWRRITWEMKEQTE
jgi:integrase